MDGDNELDAKEIEITPEMIEAGGEALAGYNLDFYGEEDWARWVYVAMRRASRRKSASTNEGVAHGQALSRT